MLGFIQIPNFMWLRKSRAYVEKKTDLHVMKKKCIKSVVDLNNLYFSESR